MTRYKMGTNETTTILRDFRGPSLSHYNKAGGTQKASLRHFPLYESGKKI